MTGVVGSLCSGPQGPLVPIESSPLVESSPLECGIYLETCSNE